MLESVTKTETENRIEFSKSKWTKPYYQTPLVSEL